MKRKFLYRLFFIFLIGIAISINTYSQDTPVITDTVVTEDYSEEDDSIDEEPYYPDTLKQVYRSITYDSILAITTDKGFYYKRYMDSLLKATQVKAEKPRRINLNGARFFNSAIGVIFWIVAICLFAYLVYKLFLSNSSFLSRNRKNVESDITTATEENTDDPDTLLRNAIRNGNYRLAVRYLYLQSLKKLSEKKFIEINSNKTNYEYVREIRHQRFVNEFASLTLQYEYVWYGEYPVDQRLFEQIQEGFTQFNKNHIR